MNAKCITCGKKLDEHSAGEKARCDLRAAEAKARSMYRADGGLMAGRSVSEYEAARRSVVDYAMKLEEVAENISQREDAEYTLAQWS